MAGFSWEEGSLGRRSAERGTGCGAKRGKAGLRWGTEEQVVDVWGCAFV